MRISDWSSDVCSSDLLQQALNTFLDELVKQMQEQMAKGDPQFSEQELPPDTQMLDRQDLMDMLERARELAKSGAKDAAREMLSQLRDMLENLRADPFSQQMNQDMQEAPRKTGRASTREGESQ